MGKLKMLVAFVYIAGMAFKDILNRSGCHTYKPACLESLLSSERTGASYVR